MKLLTDHVKRADVLFALRETAKDLLEPKRWAVIGGVVLLVALAGPFYTMESLGLAARLLYWGTVGISSAVSMWVINRLCGALLPGRWPRIAVGAIAGVIGILPTMGLVAMGNIVSGMGLPQAGVWGFFPYVAPTVIGISILVHLLVSRQESGTIPVLSQESSAGLFSRLPVGLGRDIIAVQAQDHYIDVVTPRGRSLILMRMSDATQDLASFPGMQVHRSWWVNLDHVTELEKTGTGGGRLVLTNGVCVPVPKSRRAEVRQAIAARKPQEA